MFDTRKVANQIKTARKKKNMTQMDLADAMGVSYQAVSNWERGNSMPDISKIPEICRVLGLSFEELVGEKSQSTKTVKRLLDEEDAKVTLEEVADIAPLLKAEKVEETIKDSAEAGIDIDLSTIVELAPFLDEETIDALCEQAVVEDAKALVGLAPFASEKTLDRMVRKYKGDLGAMLSGLAPFVSEETLDYCVESYLKGDKIQVEALMGMAPFLSEETVDKIVSHLLKNGEASKIAAFAPFSSGGVMDSMFGDKFPFHFSFKKDPGSRKTVRTPFGNRGDRKEEPEEEESEEELSWEDMDEEELAAFANKEYEAGRDVEPYLSSMDEEDVAKLAKRAIRDGKNVEAFLEYMDSDKIPKLADIALEKGLPIEPFLEYLDEDDMRKLILKMAGK